MTRPIFGISPSPGVAQQLDDFVEACVDLGAAGSEIVEAVLSAYLDTDEDRISMTRELVVRLRESR